MSAPFKLFLTLIFVGWSVMSLAADQTNAPTKSMNITNTIDAKTTFRIFRRRPENNYWDNGNAYTHMNGIQLLRALETSKPWDGKRHAAAYGALHPYPPSFEITIDWSSTKEERDTHSVVLCYGNRLFWYGGDYYEVPETSYDLVDKLFPKNK